MRWSVAAQASTHCNIEGEPTSMARAGRESLRTIDQSCGRSLDRRGVLGAIGAVGLALVTSLAPGEAKGGNGKNKQKKKNRGANTENRRKIRNRNPSSSHTTAADIDAGTTGPQGPQGPAGAGGGRRGRRARPDRKDRRDRLGAQGPAGADGSQGPQGFQGVDGAQGSQGFQVTPARKESGSARR